MSNTKSIALINKYRGQIMGAAALWVVIYHTWYRQFSPETVPKILYYIELAIYKLGYFGVSIFFLLSGIGLSYAIGKYSLKEFWLRRFRRLAYPVLIAAAVRALMEGWSFPHYLFAVTGIGFFIEKSYFLWFISAISAAYLVFPLYWRFFSRSRSKLRFTVLFIAALYLGSILVPKADNAIASSLYKLISNSCAPPFVLGVFFGWAQQNGGLKLSRRAFNTAAFISAAVSVALGWLYKIHSIYIFGFFPELLAAFGFTALLAELFGLFDRAGGASRAVNKFFGFYGKLSLEVYCTHEFIVAPVLVPALWSVGIVGLAVNLIEIASFALAGWLLHIISDRALRLTDRLISSAASDRA